MEEDAVSKERAGWRDWIVPPVVLPIFFIVLIVGAVILQW